MSERLYFLRVADHAEHVINAVRERSDPITAPYRRAFQGMGRERRRPAPLRPLTPSRVAESRRELEQAINRSAPTIEPPDPLFPAGEINARRCELSAELSWSLGSARVSPRQ